GLVLGIAAALSPLAVSKAGHSYVVGSKNFSEQAILSELMASRLEALGAHVVQKQDLGSATAYRALAAAELDVYVDYSGTLWANVLGRRDNPGREVVLRELTSTLARRDGVLVLS